MPCTFQLLETSANGFWYGRRYISDVLYRVTVLKTGWAVENRPAVLDLLASGGCKKVVVEGRPFSKLTHSVSTGCESQLSGRRRRKNEGIEVG